MELFMTLRMLPTNYYGNLNNLIICLTKKLMVNYFFKIVKIGING